MKLKNTVREFAVITFAMLIVSAAVYPLQAIRYLILLRIL